MYGSAVISYRVVGFTNRLACGGRRFPPLLQIEILKSQLVVFPEIVANLTDVNLVQRGAGQGHF